MAIVIALRTAIPPVRASVLTVSLTIAMSLPTPGAFHRNNKLTGLARSYTPEGPL